MRASTSTRAAPVSSPSRLKGLAAAPLHRRSA
jgi:hypothetical protein